MPGSSAIVQLGKPFQDEAAAMGLTYGLVPLVSLLSSPTPLFSSTHCAAADSQLLKPTTVFDRDLM